MHIKSRLLNNSGKMITAQVARQETGKEHFGNIYGLFSQKKKHIWSANVPQKVRIFAWRLASEGLATQLNKHRRRIIKNPACEICGAPAKDGFHANVACTKSIALRAELRKCWRLPPEEEFVQSGPDWLLLLLDHTDSHTRSLTHLMLWRVWFLRNDAVHCHGKNSVCGSVQFLQHYAETLLLTRQKADDPKGKQIAQHMGQQKPNSDKELKKEHKQHWKPPPVGWAKINVDGAFTVEDGRCGLGIVIRNSEGKVLLSSWRFIRQCRTAEEAEVMACCEGLKLACALVANRLASNTQESSLSLGKKKERRPTHLMLMYMTENLKV